MSVEIAYDKAQLRSITRSFKAMSDEAIDAAKRESSALAEFLQLKVRETAQRRTVSGAAVRRVAEGSRVAKSSKIGEVSFGFAAQKFSGGGTTQKLWAGLEFGSNRYKQFPRRTPTLNGGSAGYFIYPTLRSIQPELVAKWEAAFDRILKEYD
jgi:hypothetical protein